jgi:hypothetical protein
METIAVVAVIAGVSGLVVAVLTHLKHSKCRNGEFEITTTESHTPTLQTPSQTLNAIIERQHTTTPIENDVFRPITSQPIPIPDDKMQKLINQRLHRL